MFAGRFFRAGDRIRRVNVLREVTAESPIRADLGERVDHCAYPNGKVVVLGIPDRHVNHSCDPNAYELFEDDSSYIVARRDIRSGEEITVDYNINITEGTAWPCRCGAGRCRGEVAGDFFRLPREWQHEYRPLMATWFVERNRERVHALEFKSTARKDECARLEPVRCSGRCSLQRPFHCRSSSSATACFGFICSSRSSTAIPSFERPALKWIFASVT